MTDVAYIALGSNLGNRDLALARALGVVQAAVRPGAPSTHVAAAVIWVAVAFVACYVPANRASRVDPMEALRHE